MSTVTKIQFFRKSSEHDIWNISTEVKTPTVLYLMRTGNFQNVAKM